MSKMLNTCTNFWHVWEIIIPNHRIGARVGFVFVGGNSAAKMLEYIPVMGCSRSHLSSDGHHPCPLEFHHPIAVPHILQMRTMYISVEIYICCISEWQLDILYCLLLTMKAVMHRLVSAAVGLVSVAVRLVSAAVILVSAAV